VHATDQQTSSQNDDSFLKWYEALEKRHMADLSFQEVRRAVQALSTAYVEKRQTGARQALGSAGKRAAFALFYAPLHFLAVREIVRTLGAAAEFGNKIVDLGCGTGVAGAAWALEAGATSSIVGIERHPWAVGEARWTYRKLGIRGTVQPVDLNSTPLPGRGAGIVAAFTVNELESDQRDVIRQRLLEAGQRGASVLVVEPIARRVTPWWDDWKTVFDGSGGRADDWRMRTELPPSLRLMDKAAHLDHRELTARSIWLPGRR
jgi:hypothetical protein